MYDEETYRLILQDDLTNRTQVLREEGFKKQLPRAEIDEKGNATIFYEDERNTARIDNDTIDRIIDDSHTPPEATGEEELLIREAYDASLYRYNHELSMLRRDEIKARQAQDPAWIAQAKAHRLKLQDEVMSIGRKRLLMRGLAQQYGEDDATRLMRLYELVHGVGEFEHFQMGKLLVSINQPGFCPELLTYGYGPEKSKGFFDDIERAYALLGMVEGETHVSQQTGRFYQDHNAFAEGEGKVLLADQEMTVRCRVYKNGFKDSFACQLTSAQLPLNLEGIAHYTPLFLPTYQLDELAIPFGQGFMPMLRLSPQDPDWYILASTDSRLHFIGEPRALRRELPQVLSAYAAAFEHHKQDKTHDSTEQE